jgi:hypothetical protein
MAFSKNESAGQNDSTETASDRSKEAPAFSTSLSNYPRKSVPSDDGGAYIDWAYRGAALGLFVCFVFGSESMAKALEHNLDSAVTYGAICIFVCISLGIAAFLCVRIASAKGNPSARATRRFLVAALVLHLSLFVVGAIFCFACLA